MSNFEIACLVPDLPAPEEYSAFLTEMHVNRWYTNFGPLTRRFETEMSSFLSNLGSPGLITGTFSSATTALELVLRAIELPKGSRILIPALTFPATALAVINAGHVPVLADVDSDSWTLTAHIAHQAHMSSPIAAVIPVAAFGLPIEPKPWQKFQSETGVPVIFDAAAALGQQQVTPDLTAIFSLHATKPFGVGEGGLLVTSDQNLVTKAQSLSNFGFIGSAGVVQNIGTNAKLGEYYAAVGLAQINRWSVVHARRRKVAQLYEIYLRPFAKKIYRQKSMNNFVPAVMPVFVKNKGLELFDALMKKGVQARRWYTPLLHRHPALDDLQVSVGNSKDLVVANNLEKGLIGLPFHAFLSEGDIVNICKILEDNCCG